VDAAQALNSKKWFYHPGIILGSVGLRPSSCSSSWHHPAIILASWHHPGIILPLMAYVFEKGSIFCRKTILAYFLIHHPARPG